MEGYLHVRAGRLGMLLPVAGVLEVLEVERTGMAAGHALWRERSLPVLSAHRLLDECEALAEGDIEGPSTKLHAAVVYAPSPTASPCLLLVDRVAGLTLGANLAPLRRAAATAAHFFAATASGADGERLYCLRRPLPSLELPPVLAGHADDAFSEEKQAIAEAQ